MYRIRRSNALDGERVVDIWSGAVDETHDFLKATDRAEIERDVREFLPGLPLWLALDRNCRPIGFMGMTGSHMDALFVDPAFLSTGVGRALVEHALRQNKTITADVNEQNIRARGFYRRMGFVSMGRSERDDRGRPYPLIHLQRRER